MLEEEVSVCVCVCVRERERDYMFCVILSFFGGLYSYRWYFYVNLVQDLTVSLFYMQAGSCMHIHVPGVSVTECPRCLAGEPVSLSMQHMTVYTTIVCFFPQANNQ